MERYYDYIDASLTDDGRNKTVYKFKRRIADEMSGRVLQLKSAGLKDDNVIYDLIVSEHPDLKSEFNDFIQEEDKAKKRKKFIIANIVGSVVYIIVLLVIFILFSMSTHLWDKTWVFFVDGIIIWVVYLLVTGAAAVTRLKRVFHFIARIMLFGAVMLLSVCALLFCVAIVETQYAWLCIIAGLIAAFITDGIYVSVTKQRLALMNWLVYIVVISVFVYIILCALRVLLWSTGWFVIPASLAVDALIVSEAIRKNARLSESD